jgi:hypothetical protein
MVRSRCGIGLLAFVTALESLTRGKQIVFVANDLQYHWIIVLDFDVGVQLVWHWPPVVPASMVRSRCGIGLPA